MFVYLYVQEVFTNLHNSLLIVLISEEWDWKSLKMGGEDKQCIINF